MAEISKEEAARLYSQLTGSQSPQSSQIPQNSLQKEQQITSNAGQPVSTGQISKEEASRLYSQLTGAQNNRQQSSNFLNNLLNKAVGVVESPIGVGLSSAGQSLAQQLLNAGTAGTNLVRRALNKPEVSAPQAVQAPGAAQHPLASDVGKFAGGALGYSGLA